MTEDERWMTAALAEAARAEAIDEVPVGAILILRNNIIGHGHNQPISLHDPTAHAEVLALRAAARTIANYRLSESTLYVTVEPCLMCMGALIHARVQRLVFGCFDPKGGAAGSLYNLADDDRLNHRIHVTTGILAEECRTLLQRFFRYKRQ